MPSCTVYAFYQSGLSFREGAVVADCPQEDWGIACSAGPTITVNNCKVDVVTPAGDVRPGNTWVTVLYLEEYQLTLVFAHEGTAEITPLVSIAAAAPDSTQKFVVPEGSFAYILPQENQATLATVLDTTAYRPHTTIPIADAAQLAKALELDSRLQAVNQQLKESGVPNLIPLSPTTEEAPLVRNETLYTSGTQWGPPTSWNPFNLGASAMGTVGLCYETLFIYDPLADEYIPWLAESGSWTSDTVYTLRVRKGVKWSDGAPFTAADVKFTFELGQTVPVNTSTVWQYLDNISQVDDYTLQFSYKTALHQPWENTLYNTAVVPQHIWSAFSAEDITTGANESPVGTGPYLFESYDQDRMVWTKNDNWWARSALGLDPQPRWIVDIVNSGDNAALSSRLLSGDLDLSNNFLPDAATLVKGGYGVQTYYPEPPYMLSANTVVLFLNTTKKPLDDAHFRRPLAFAIDVPSIVNVAYGPLVRVASPTSLLPSLDRFVDQDVVARLGYSFDTERARQTLADAGYKDVNGDGFVEAPDGSTIALRVTCPSGWTDWMDAINVIATSAQAAGINVQAATPDYGAWNAALQDGTFDMTLNNWAAMSNTPWTLYNFLFWHPIQGQMQNGNFGRYDDQQMFELVDALARVQVSDEGAMEAACSEIQDLMLTEMPVIPLWYGGAWAQYSNAVWTNWPSSGEGSNHYLPVTWHGYWNMTAILMLCDLKSAGQ